MASGSCRSFKGNSWSECVPLLEQEGNTPASMPCASLPNIQEDLHLIDPNQRPVQRNQNEQDKRLCNSEDQAYLEKILCLEIAVGISHNEHCALVCEYLSTGCKCPDHTDGQRMQSLRVKELEHYRKRSAQHGGLVGEEEMIDEGSPVQNERGGQGAGHQGCHPTHHRTCQDFQPLRLGKNPAHTQSGRGKPDRAEIEFE